MKYNFSEDESNFLNDTWKKLENKLSITSERIGSSIPYIATNHKYDDVGEDRLTWWTNGFWGGTLWQMYHATNDSKYRDIAKTIEKRLDGALIKTNELDHDVGFMWLNTAVADYSLTDNQESYKRGLKAASILAARYNPIGKYLIAWNGSDKQGQVIVDCFMNLPLLYWASKQTGDIHFAQIATEHTKTATKALLRADGSSNHIAVFDPSTGVLKESLGGQGYGDGSSWSRGQAWSIYGLALAYRDTRDEQYLEKAKLAANYFISNVSLDGYVSLIDFRAPRIPIYYDTTATAIAICGLLELVKYLPTNERYMYQQSAFRMFKSLTDGFCDFDLQHDEILTKGSAKYHRESDREVPIIYGDTFYLEALLRFLDLDLKIY